MRDPPDIPMWKVRLLAAAAGAGASLMLALLTFITVVGFVVGVVGVPVGAVVGAIFGPSLIKTERRWLTILAAGVAAASLGGLVWAVVSAIGQRRDASVQDLLAYTGATVVAVLGVVLTVGLVMSIAAAVIATWWLRRTVPQGVHSVWPAVVVVLVVVLATALVTAEAVRDPGDLAALVGDQVQMEYLIRSDHEARPGEAGLLLEVRSYWNGQLSGGSSGAIRNCSSGSEGIQSSDWGIWIGRDDGSWLDRPDGAPLVSDRDVEDGPVRITIHVEGSGAASWELGLQRDGC
jgi:hypothetical protein